MCVAPVAVVGVDAVAAEVFVGERVDDIDGFLVDEDEDGGSGAVGADTEVVHAAGAAQADFSVAVDGVDADPVVGPVAGCGLWWGRFDGGGVGVGWGAVVGAVDALAVVDDSESLELALQASEAGGGRLGGEPALEGLVESFDLALGLGVAGVAVVLDDAEFGESRYSKALRPPTKRAV